MSLEALNQNTMQRITVCKDKIEKLHNRFEQMLGVQGYDDVHKIMFGYFLSEYILKLKIASVYDDSDTIFLCGRRLLEVFIISKYISMMDAFSKMVEYCDKDRYDYLKGCNARIVADEKFFPELKDLDNYAFENAQEQEEILKRYDGEIPDSINKKADMKAMAIAIGYEEEYTYFYKFTSKMLHFCPFSLNGDAYFEHAIHKVVFLIRIAKYLEEIAKELEHIYQSVPSPS